MCAVAAVGAVSDETISTRLIRVSDDATSMLKVTIPDSFVYLPAISDMAARVG
jgi:hypothetical protein